MLPGTQRRRELRPGQPQGLICFRGSLPRSALSPVATEAKGHPSAIWTHGLLLRTGEGTGATRPHPGPGVCGPCCPAPELCASPTPAREPHTQACLSSLEDQAGPEPLRGTRWDWRKPGLVTPSPNGQPVSLSAPCTGVGD